MTRFNVRHAVATWNDVDENGIHVVAACGCGWTQRADGVADLLGAAGNPAADALLIAMGAHSIGMEPIPPEPRPVVRKKQMSGAGKQLQRRKRERETS